MRLSRKNLKGIPAYPFRGMARLLQGLYGQERRRAGADFTKILIIGAARAPFRIDNELRPSLSVAVLLQSPDPGALVRQHAT